MHETDHENDSKDLHNVTKDFYFIYEYYKKIYKNIKLQNCFQSW